jgi:hypothetical protein
MEAVHSGLREVGYVEGQSLIVIYRYAEGKFLRRSSAGHPGSALSNASKRRKPARCQHITVSGRIILMALSMDGNQRYSWMKKRRSLLVNWTRPRIWRCSTTSCGLNAPFSASSRLLGLPRFKKRNIISAAIAAEVKRFCRQSKTDEVFGTHRICAAAR